MQAVNLNGDLEDSFSDNNKIPKAHLNSVCQFKKGEKTCRYICLTSSGYFCVKKSKMKSMLDERVKKNQMSAKGDNCEGLNS